MQNSQVPEMLQEPWGTTSPNIRTIPYTTSTPGAASWTVGFPQVCFDPYNTDGMAIDGLDVQGVLNALSAAVRWQCAGAVYPWNSTFQSSSYVGGYPKGSRASSSDYAFNWLSTAENNTTNPETTLTTIPTWVPEDASMLPLTVAGSNIILTALQAGKSVIVLNGTLTANISITMPLFPGMRWTFVCHYSNTSSYAIQVTNSACTTYSPIVMGSHNSTTQIVCNDDGSLSFTEADTSQEVSSVAFLRNSSYFIGSGGYERTMVLNGYSSDGDSGGGLKFKWLWNGTSGYYQDNGGTIFTAGAGGKGAWVALPGQQLSALNFGADPTGTNDSTTSLNNYYGWVHGLASSAGKNTALGRVYIPTGVYLFTSLTVPHGILTIGDGCGTSPDAGSGYYGYGGTTLVCTNTSGSNGLNIGSGTQLQTGLIFEKLRITSQHTSAGAGLNLSYAAQNVVLRDAIIDGFSTGIAPTNCTEITLDNTVVYNNNTNINLGANCQRMNVLNSRITAPITGANITVTGSNCGDLNLLGSTISGGASDQITVQTGGSLRALNVLRNRVLGVASGFSFVNLASNTTNGGHISGNFWDAINPSTFVTVAGGNSNITIDEMSLGYTPNTSATYVNFASGAIACEAYLPSYNQLGVGNGVNASNGCRIYNRKADEVGVSYYPASSQSLPSNAFTTITFGTQNYDPKSEFNGTQFQPKDYGIYEVTCHVTLIPYASGDSYNLGIYNTAVSGYVGWSYQSVADVGNNTISGTFVLALGPSDIIQARIQVGIDGGVATLGGDRNTSFRCRRVG